MSDITKCYGIDCPVRDKCWRYTASAERYQSYFTENPSDVINDRFTCDVYWGEDGRSVWSDNKVKEYDEISDELNRRYKK